MVDSSRGNLTIDELQEWLSRSEPQTDVVLVDRNEPVPASWSQLGMWLATELAPADNTSYVVEHAFVIDGALDVDHLVRCVEALVDRHETFRTGFELHGGRLMQILNRPSTFAVEVNWLEGEPAADDDVLARMSEFIGRPFLLDEPPLIRCAVYKVSPQRHYLQFAVHHIANDAWSMAVFFNELDVLYKGGLLPDRSYQYSDYAYEQMQSLERGDFDDSIRFWKQELEGAPAELHLADMRHQNEEFDRGFSGQWFERDLTGYENDALGKLCEATTSTRFAVVTAALQRTVACAAGEDDVVIGVGVSGRVDSRLETMIGPISGKVGLRSWHARSGLLERIEEVKAKLPELEQHSRVPFEFLLQELNVPTTRNRLPLVQVSITSHESMLTRSSIGDLRLRPVRAHSPDVQRELIVYLSASPSDGRQRLMVGYAVEHVDGDTARRIIEETLTSIVESAISLDGQRNVQSRGDVTTVVQRCWRQVMGEVDFDRSFFELGGRSIEAIRLSEEISNQLGLVVTVSLLCEADNLDELVGMISSTKNAKDLG